MFNLNCHVLLLAVALWDCWLVWPVVKCFTCSSLAARSTHAFISSQVTASCERLQSNKKEQESELAELRQNKELLTQWEQQIADIIQWVTEEKDARAYLKSMAKKLADDVEGLKNTAGTLNRVLCMYMYIYNVNVYIYV